MAHAIFTHSYCFPDPKESYLMFSAAGCSLESDKHTRTPIGGVP